MDKLYIFWGWGLKSITGKVVLALAVLSLPSQLAAQDYPMPGSSTEPPVICTTCGGAAKNKPTYPYALPLKKFVGRYVDAQATRVYQHGFGYRSIRAREVFFAPERDRVYVMMGQTFAAYKLSTWFTQKLGQPLVRITGFADPGLLREKYLSWDASVYPENQGWEAPYTDGNDRLYGADFDDRGNCYLAYSVFGWGIVKDTGGASFELTDQQFDPNLPAPTKVAVFKHNASYYAIVSDGGPGAYLYDVTNPVGVVGAPPRPPLRQLTFGVQSFAKTTSNNVIAIVDHQFKLRLFAADSIIAGGGGGTLIPARSGSEFISVTSDGTNFYATERKALDSSLSVLVAGSNGFPSSYTETKYPVPAITSWGVHYGAGYVNVWGNDPRGGNVKVYKLENNVPREISFGNFFQYYYTNPPDGSYAKPDANTAIAADAVVHEYQGKKYFIYSIWGLGDVYELEAGDSIDIEVKGTTYGTQNPSSPTKTQGPFYGDRITFKSTSSRSPMTVRWNFGNPEAASGNQVDMAAGTDVSYRYTGLTAAAAITAPKKVVAQDVSASSTKDELTINLLTPIARMGIKNTDLLFVQPNASSAAQIVLGDLITDSSDGSTEGHYGSWTLDSLPSSLIPTATLPVGVCGTHTAALTARYVPYTGAVPTHTETQFYTSTAGPVTFAVRPFAAALSINSSLTTATKLHFKNDTRLGAGVSLPSSVKWEHIAANGTTVLDTKNAASYELDKSPSLAGTKIVLTVTAEASQVPAACASYLVSQATYLLIAPDPKIDAAGCGNVGDDCTLTAGSLSGGSVGDWTFQWFLDSQAVGTNSKTLDLKALLTSAKTYQVKLKASNAVTFTEVTKSLPVAAAVCVGAPTNISITHSVTDATLRKVSFTAYHFSRARQACDSASWNFGDATTSTEWSPIHTFPGNGPYTVTLVVSNANGTYNTSTSISFGSAQPPPPPPPPPPPTPGGCTVSGGRVYPDYTGASSGCSTLNSSQPCGAGEVITGRVTAFGSVLSASCPTNWTWGDGGTSTGLTSQHTYSQPGTYNVSVTYGDGATGGMTITVGGTQQPPTPPPTPGCTVSGGRVYPEYTGSTSSCTPLSATKCRTQDIVNFRLAAFGGTLSASCPTSWNFGDGGTGTGLTPTHQYASPGTYTVSVTYGGGTATGSIPITIEAGNPAVSPPVVMGMDLSASSPAVGAEITFTASVQSSASITAYNWNFGDGQTGSGQTVKHTYAGKGDYDVSLVVINEGGPSAPFIRRISVSDVPRFRFLLPVVVHAPGLNNSLWRTDLQIFDPNRTEAQTQPLDLKFDFNGQSKNLQMNSSTYIFEDFMSFFTNENGAGTALVEVSSRTAPQMWTRIYNVSASGIGTFGQVIPAVSLDNTQNLSTDSPAYVVAGVRSSQRYRTNVGLINLGLNATTVTIGAFDDRFGAQLGEFTQTLNPFQLFQADVQGRISNLPADRPYSLRIAAANNTPLMAYGSMVDNFSNDPVFIAAVPESAQSGPAMRTQVLPGVGHFGSWRTDTTIFNPDARGVAFKIRYFDTTGVKRAEADFAAAPNTFIQLDDVLQSSAFTVSGDSVGILQIETTSAGVNKYPIVFGRTYNDQQAAGTYGQGINAFASSNVNVRPGKPAFVPGIRNDSAYYTNAGLVNVSNETTIVLVSLLDKNTGTPIPLQPIMLAPFQSVIGNLLGNSTADAGTLKFEILTGGSVWAYASMVDKLTRDPEYIPAVPTP